MKICKEAIGIKGDEWVLFNDVLNELSSTSKNKDLIDRFHNFLVSTSEQDEIRKQKSWERIKKKRELNPNYARPKNDSKESSIDMSKEEILKESLTFNEAFKQLKSCEDSCSRKILKESNENIKEGDYIIFNTIDDELADWKEQHPSKNGYKVVEVDREKDGSPTGMYFIKGCPFAIDHNEDGVEKIDIKELKKGKSIKESKWNREASTISDDVEIQVDEISGQVIYSVKEAERFVGYTDEEIVEELRDEYGDDISIKRVYYDEEGIPANYEPLYDKDYMYDELTPDEVEFKEKVQSKEDGGLQPIQKYIKPALKDFADRHEKAGKKVPKYIKDYVNNKKKGEK